MTSYAEMRNFISRTLVYLANFVFASLISNYKPINFYNQRTPIKLSMTQGKGSFRQSTIIKQNDCACIITANVRCNLSLGTIIGKKKMENNTRHLCIISTFQQQQLRAPAKSIMCALFLTMEKSLVSLFLN
jgi:hypothetical protein